MKMIPALCALGALLLLPSCGRNPHEAFADDMITVVGEMTDVLATVTDKETAEKAAPRIEEVAGKMNALAERGQELGDPPDDLKKELSEKIQEPMRKFSGEMMRISRIEGAAETVMKALEAMQPK